MTDKKLYYVVTYKGRYVRVNSNGSFDTLDDFWKATWWKDLFTAQIWVETQWGIGYKIVELEVSGLVREVRGKR